jgi:hypothetical protein
MELDESEREALPNLEAAAALYLPQPEVHIRCQHVNGKLLGGHQPTPASLFVACRCAKCARKAGAGRVDSRTVFSLFEWCRHAMGADPSGGTSSIMSQHVRVVTAGAAVREGPAAAVQTGGAHKGRRSQRTAATALHSTCCSQLRTMQGQGYQLCALSAQEVPLLQWQRELLSSYHAPPRGRNVDRTDSLKDKRVWVYWYAEGWGGCFGCCERKNLSMLAR